MEPEMQPGVVESHKDTSAAQSQSAEQTQGFPGLPDPLYRQESDEDITPGFWATRAKECPWTRGSSAIRSPGKYLNTISTMPLQREPVLRYPRKRGRRRHVDGQTFNGQVGHQRENIEALLAYAVGQKTPPEGQCESCLRGDGKFVKCVICPGTTHCASCHWRGQANRCSFNDKASSESPEEKVNKPSVERSTIPQDFPNSPPVQRPIAPKARSSSNDRRAYEKALKQYEKAKRSFHKGMRKLSAKYDNLRATKKVLKTARKQLDIRQDNDRNA